jgi:RNA polymerase sigma-70 factor, ECF subfamily
MAWESSGLLPGPQLAILAQPRKGERPPGRRLSRNLEPSPVFATLLRTMSANADPDAALMLRVRDGDRDAFAQLVDRYKQPVINLIARTINDPIEAEDLAQNAFVQAYKSAHRYEVTAKFSTWLFTIARNLALNEIRRRSRHRADSLDQTFEDSEEHPVRQVEDRRSPGATASLLRTELENKVEEALEDLPEKQRAALMLCREEEMSYEEIASVIGCTLSATKSLIHRARETLKERLKPYLQTGAWDEE